VSVADERIERLERQVEALLAKIAALEAENAELRRRLGESSSNSGKPPSPDAPKERAARPEPAPSGKLRSTAIDLRSTRDDGSVMRHHM
jgi:regulator of replication initiation timing